MKRALLLVVCLGAILGVFIWYQGQNTAGKTDSMTNMPNLDEGGAIGGSKENHPLQIEVMRKKVYPGSNLVIEETLALGSNYNRYIASYKSEGLKIYGLLTVPIGDKPKGGWPVVIFNHGFIPPEQYRTTERYIAYTDAFSRNGYILFRPDYRGHGNSEGEAAGGYGSPAYTIDVLNAVATLKKYKDADPDLIGMWGHSMGGYITLRSMVIDPSIKAGVVWAGVVASYPDLINNWRRRPTNQPTIPLPSGARRWRSELVRLYGDPKNGDPFWDSISANSYLKDISGELQLHHGTADESVPYAFSQTLEKQMKEVGKPVELYIYDGDTHDIPNNFSTAMQRSIEFFDKYVKAQE